MTVSLDGYLEPQRLSFSSPPEDEFVPRASSPDDTFPVFSPPPVSETCEIGFLRSDLMLCNECILAKRTTISTNKYANASCTTISSYGHADETTQTSVEFEYCIMAAK